MDKQQESIGRFPTPTEMAQAEINTETPRYPYEQEQLERLIRHDELLGKETGLTQSYRAMLEQVKCTATEQQKAEFRAEAVDQARQLVETVIEQMAALDRHNALATPSVVRQQLSAATRILLSYAEPVCDCGAALIIYLGDVQCILREACEYADS